MTTSIQNLTPYNFRHATMVVKYYIMYIVTLQMKFTLSSIALTQTRETQRINIIQKLFAIL